MNRISFGLCLVVLGTSAADCLGQIEAEIQIDSKRLLVPIEMKSAQPISVLIENRPKGAVAAADPADHDRYHQLMFERISRLDAAAQASLAEDVQILGHIVAQNLLAVYDATPQPGGMTGMSALLLEGRGGPMSASGSMSGGAGMGFDVLTDSAMGPMAAWVAARPTVRVNGQYVPGVGVAFQIEAPPLVPEPKAKPAKADASPCPVLSLSRWEQARRQLRGELKQSDCRQCHQKAHVSDGLHWHAGADVNQADCRQCHVAVAPPAARLQVVVTDRNSNAAPTRAKLIDTIVKTLVENAANVAQLQPQERLIVAVTFQPSYVRTTHGGRFDILLDPSRSGIAPSPAPVPQPVPVAPSAPPRASSGAGFQPAVSGIGAGGGASPPLQPAAPAAEVLNPAKSDPPTIVYEPVIKALPGANVTFEAQAPSGGGAAVDFVAPMGQEAIGDLHLRQGNHAKAIEAYEQATKEWSANKPQFADITRIWTADGHVDQLLSHAVSSDPATLRRLLGKLLQTHVAAGNLERSQQLLTTIKSLERLRSSAAARPKQALPARLVVSMSRAQLNLSADEKADFKKVRAKALVYFFEPFPAATPSTPAPPPTAPGIGVPRPPQPAAPASKDTGGGPASPPRPAESKAAP